MSTTIGGAQQATAPFAKLLDPTDGVWHASVPSRIYRAYHAEEQAGWARWSRHLRRRTTPRPLAELAIKGAVALLWGVADSELPDETRALIRRLDKLAPAKAKKTVDADVALRLTQWTNAGAGETASLAWILTGLAYCHALPRLAADVPSQVWWDALNRLVSLAVGDAPAGADALNRQLLGGELRLTLARLFPELIACRDLAAPGRNAIATSLSSVLTTKGFPGAEHWQCFPALWASWTRSRAIGRRLKAAKWDKKREKLYLAAARNALRLTRTDGSMVLTRVSGSTDATAVDCRPILKVAQRLVADDRLDRAARACLEDKQASGLTRGKLPSSAAHCEQAGVAILRSDWSPTGPRLAVHWRKDELFVELDAHRQVFLSGRWDTEIRFRGVALGRAGDWTQSCWISDRNVDYLELELELDQGLRIERQVAISRRDRMLLVADAVFAPEPGMIEYATTLPLAQAVAFEPAAETREGRLVARRSTATVLPLALAEWRSDHRSGSLKTSSAGLRLEQASHGRALFAPLLLELKTERPAEDLTWRALTVSENRVITSSDVAVGYRAQIGKRQWLVYRSFTAAANRSVLGQNLASDFLFARFRRTGKTDRFVEIECDEEEEASPAS